MRLKEILFVIFALLFVVGLIVFRLRFIKDRNPNAELLIDLLRWMSANGSEAIQKKESEDGRHGRSYRTAPGSE
jgi:hypothetical protein